LGGFSPFMGRCFCSALNLEIEVCFNLHLESRQSPLELYFLHDLALQKKSPSKPPILSIREREREREKEKAPPIGEAYLLFFIAFNKECEEFYGFIKDTTLYIYLEYGLNISRHEGLHHLLSGIFGKSSELIEIVVVVNCIKQLSCASTIVDVVGINYCVEEMLVIVHGFHYFTCPSSDYGFLKQTEGNLTDLTHNIGF